MRIKLPVSLLHPQFKEYVDYCCPYRGKYNWYELHQISGKRFPVQLPASLYLVKSLSNAAMDQVRSPYQVHLCFYYFDCCCQESGFEMDGLLFERSFWKQI